MFSDLATFLQARQALAEFQPASRLQRHTGKLDSMRQLLAHVGDPHQKLRVIHVAGTSGKTSTAYYAAALLHARGLRVGLTVSPHADEINERVQRDMQPLPEAEFCQRLSQFLALVQTCPVRPTYFELMIAFALWCFAQDEVEYAVVEVGIGGLLDSTNVLDAPDKVCIITDIGLDHVGVLGRTLPEIAAQKAGIIHLGNTVFCYEQAAEIMQPIRARVGTGAQLHIVKEASSPLADHLPLFQQRNFGLAWAAVQYVLNRDSYVPLTPKQAEATAQATHIPARMEIRHIAGKTIILDAAHNPQKLQALLDSIRAAFPGQPIAALLGFLRGHATQNAETLAPLLSYAVITGFPRLPHDLYASADPEIVAKTYQKASAQYQIVPQVAEALAALMARPEPVLLVTGSFYLLNHVRPLLLPGSLPAAKSKPLKLTLK